MPRRSNDISKKKTVKIKDERRRSSSRAAPPVREASPLPVYSPRTQEHGPYYMPNLVKMLPRTRIVDFSFLDLDELVELKSTQPRSGIAHKKPEQKQDPNDDGPKKLDKKDLQAMTSQTLFFGAGSGKTHRTDDGFMVMRAKEETYAYRESTDDPLNNDKEMHRYVLNADGVLVEKKDYKEAEAEAEEEVQYRCTTLKVNNNSLTSLTQWCTVIPRMLWKPATSLTIVDFSCNLVSELPTDFYGCPIHTLLLHSNKIETLDEVKKLQCLHDTLKKLTLNGNPVQSAVKRYKFAVLHVLPFLMSFDDARITLADREKMDIFEHIFVKKEERGSTMGLLPPLMPRSQSQLGVLGEYF